MHRNPGEGHRSVVRSAFAVTWALEELFAPWNGVAKSRGARLGRLDAVARLLPHLRHGIHRNTYRSGMQGAAL